MKRIIAALAITTALLAFNSTAAFASCSQHTIYQDGRIIICSTCCFGSNCNTTCF